MRVALILAVAVIVIGAAVLPSVFAGKTTMTFNKSYDSYDYEWVLEDMNATDGMIDLNFSAGCAGCHGTIQDHLNNSSIHSDFSCEECHRMTRTASGEELEYSGKTHDLFMPRCLDCHENNGIYSNDTGVEKQAPTATGFNESGYGTNSSAHKKFVEESLNFGFSKGENEACVSCHTNQLTEVTYKYFWNIEYSIDGWRISSLSYNGTREHTSNYTKSGEKHVFSSKNDINCVGCHQNVYDTLVYGTGSADESYLSHAPIEINTDSSSRTEWSEKNDCWNNFRYHYVSSSNRAEGVNTEYCTECHKVDRFAEVYDGPTDYNLQSVIDDTNSKSVHAAESVSCGTCHGDGKTKEPMNSDHNPSGFVELVSTTYARTIVGDTCMGCHQAAVHPDNPEKSCNCHTSNTYVKNIYIESEPSGLACNSRGKPCPTGPEAYFIFSPAQPEPGESVSFDASGSTDGIIVSYKWEFGDGNTTTVSDPTVSHTYSSEGNYIVNLTVTADSGLKDTYTDTVNVVSGGCPSCSTCCPNWSYTASGGYSIKFELLNGKYKWTINNPNPDAGVYLTLDNDTSTDTYYRLWYSANCPTTLYDRDSVCYQKCSPGVCSQPPADNWRLKGAYHDMLDGVTIDVQNSGRKIVFTIPDSFSTSCITDMIDSGHEGLFFPYDPVSNGAPRGEVNVDEGYDPASGEPDCSSVEYTQIEVACPVNVTITDEYGNIIADNGTNKITNADLITVDHTKIFYLPANLKYSAEIDAYDYGTFNFTRVPPAGSDIPTTKFENVSVTPNTTAFVGIEPDETDCLLSIDHDGDGIFDEERSPDVNEISTKELSTEEPESSETEPTETSQPADDRSGAGQSGAGGGGGGGLPLSATVSTETPTPATTSSVGELSISSTPSTSEEKPVGASIETETPTAQPTA
ncbi:MAG: PKD domain-containing protein, partial [Halobacteriota archaeon]